MDTTAKNGGEMDVNEIFTSKAQQASTVEQGETIIELKDVTIRFNKNNLKIDNLKEYFIRLVTRQLMFQEFIALKDINLEIKKGEAWGFIGTNGAGKSTLLKVVSRILKPSSGTVSVSGTVAALIELGAGIDPQLTARENIFLNGTLLGYSKAFIESKFDEIVEFSELQDFLDSPVKNFSSGMKTRLAFSVATAVNPDILIADEILAVGDMKFRKKCAAKMTAMLEAGTTLLYVSHSLPAVRKQCNKVMWLDHGHVIMVGETNKVCDAFQKEMESPVPIILAGINGNAIADPKTLAQMASANEQPKVVTAAEAAKNAAVAKKTADALTKKAVAAKKTAAELVKKAEAAKKEAAVAAKKAKELAAAEAKSEKKPAETKAEKPAETKSEKPEKQVEENVADKKPEKSISEKKETDQSPAAEVQETKCESDVLDDAAK